MDQSVRSKGYMWVMVEDIKCRTGKHQDRYGTPGQLIHGNLVSSQWVPEGF